MKTIEHVLAPRLGSQAGSGEDTRGNSEEMASRLKTQERIVLSEAESRKRPKLKEKGENSPFRID